MLKGRRRNSDKSLKPAPTTLSFKTLMACTGVRKRVVLMSLAPTMPSGSTYMFGIPTRRSDAPFLRPKLSLTPHVDEENKQGWVGPGGPTI